VKLWDSIDAFLAYTIELAIDAATLNSSAAPYRTHRERLWLRSQQCIEEIWGDWEWDFRYTVGASATLTAAATSCSAPSDYHVGGYEGSVWIPAQNREIMYLPLHRLLDERRRSGSATGIPDYFSIADTSSAGVPKFEFDRTADATYTLAVDYERRAPQLLDKPHAPTAADANGAGNPDGSYQYKLTLVNADGETDGSAASTSVTVATNIITVSNIYVPPGFANCTSKKLYRTITGANDYHLITTLAVSDTSYNDNTSDATAAAAAALSTSYSGLEKLPSEYHSLFLLALEVLDAKDHGDGRSAAELEGRYRKSLARAKANSAPGKERLQRVGEIGLMPWRMH
jgi:hypothetical protein